MPAIETRTATVYIGNVRRRFTKRAAYNDAAFKLMTTRCDGCSRNHGYDRDGAPYGDSCFYCCGYAMSDRETSRETDCFGGTHEEPGLSTSERWHRLHKRLARWLMWRDSKEPNS